MTKEEIGELKSHLDLVAETLTEWPIYSMFWERVCKVGKSFQSVWVFFCYSLGLGTSAEPTGLAILAFTTWN